MGDTKEWAYITPRPTPAPDLIERAVDRVRRMIAGESIQTVYGTPTDGQLEKIHYAVDYHCDLYRLAVAYIELRDQEPKK